MAVPHRIEIELQGPFGAEPPRLLESRQWQLDHAAHVAHRHRAGAEQRGEQGGMVDVSLGLEVEIPRLQLALNAWQGSAWRVEDPSSGAAGYFLAGGLAGGATTEEPENWVLDFVADALAHVRPEPNTDPLAGFEIRKLVEGDQQLGLVGEPLESRWRSRCSTRPESRSKERWWNWR